jgi:hypothetical protein
MRQRRIWEQQCRKEAKDEQEDERRRKSPTERDDVNGTFPVDMRESGCFGHGDSPWQGAPLATNLTVLGRTDLAGV